MKNTPRLVPLLLRAAHGIRQAHDRVCHTHGLTFQQFNVLRILAGAERNGDDPLPTMEIARRLVEPGPGITRFIKQLRERGLINVQPNPADERSRLCALTETGRAELRRIEPAITALTGELFKELDPAAHRELKALLDRIRY